VFQVGSTPAWCSQRAWAALIVSAATQVSMQRQGYPGRRASTAREQVERWCVAILAVHRAGGLIFKQPSHGGAHLASFMQPVTPSGITPSSQAFIENGEG
jgi:N-ethylmaleimide reductase